jgi:hypothetical protein
MGPLLRCARSAAAAAHAVFNLYMLLLLVYIHRGRIFSGIEAEVSRRKKSEEAAKARLRSENFFYDGHSLPASQRSSKQRKKESETAISTHDQEFFLRVFVESSSGSSGY